MADGVVIEDLQIKITGEASDVDEVIERVKRKLEELLKMRFQKSLAPIGQEIAKGLDKAKPQLEKLKQEYDSVVKTAKKSGAGEIAAAKAAAAEVEKAAKQKIDAAKKELAERERIAGLVQKAVQRSQTNPPSTSGPERAKISQTPRSELASSITGNYGQAAEQAAAAVRSIPYEQIEAQLNAIDQAGTSAFQSISQRAQLQQKILDQLKDDYIEVARSEGTSSKAALSLEKRIYSAQDQMRRLKENTDGVKQSMRGVAKQTDKASTSTKRLGKQYQKTGNTGKNAFSGILSTLKNIVVVGSLYKMVSMIENAIKQATETIAQGSARANETLSALSSSFGYLQNSVAAAFLPALEAITPVVTRVVDALANLFNWIGMVTARLFGGAKTVVQAKKVQKDYAASLNKTSSAAKKAEKETENATIAMDELNKLEIQEKEELSSGASGGGADIEPGAQFEEIAIPQETLDFADNLKQKLLELKDTLMNLGLEQVLNNTKEFMSQLYAQAQQYDFGTALKESLSSGFALAMSTINLGQKIVFPLAIALDIPGIVYEGINTLTALFDMLRAAVDAVTPGITNFVQIALVPIAEWIGGKVKDAFQFLQEIFAGIGEWYTEMEPTFTEFYTLLGDVVNKIWEFIAPIADAAWENFKIILGKIVEFFKKLYEHIIAFLTPFIESIKVVWEWLEALGVIDTLVSIFQNVFDGIGLIVGGIIDALGGILDFLTGIFTGDWEKVWEGIKEFFSGIWDLILGVIKSILPGFEETWENFKKSFGDSWDEAWEGIKEFFSGIWDGMKESVDKIFDGIEHLWDTFKKGFEDGWNGFWEGIGKFFSDIWDGMKKTVNNVWTWIKNKIDGIIEKIKGIPILGDAVKWITGDSKSVGGSSYGGGGGNVSPYSAFSAPIPAFASGAVLRKPTFGLMAEYAGAMSDPEIVAPQSMIYDTILSANGELAGALAGIFASAAGQIVQAITDKDFTVELDGRQISRTVQKNQLRQQKMLGG